MKLLAYILLSITILSLAVGCRTKTLFIPVESVRTEYKDKYHRDSIHLYDSIFVKEKNDTVWMEKYRYLYRDKYVTDSVFITDSIQVPYPVTEYVEVNKLRSWQYFLIWCGGITLLLIVGYILFRLGKMKL